jgi:hypothetical protein
MSDNEGGESKSIGAFLLGFLTGVLVCVGAGGALFMVSGRQAMMAREAAEMDAMVAREEAMRAAEHARLEKERTEKLLREARDAKAAKDKDKGKEKDK